jgi:hypothetical protein
MRVFVSAIVATLLAAACESGVSPPPARNVAELEAFINVPVQERLAQARVAGDQRFLGVYDYALSIPGGPDNGSAAGGRGVLPIPGTSDTPRSERESELNAKARAYALRYNELLLNQH